MTGTGTANSSRRKRASLIALTLLGALTLTAQAKIYYYYDPINDSYTFTNMCGDLRLCKPLFEEKGRVTHTKGFAYKPGMDTKYDSHIRAAADRYGLDFHLVKSVIKAESQFDANARSSKGAQGLMQLMPDTARLLGVKNAYDPEQNILGGTRYLRDMLKKFRNAEKALAAYNAGPAAVVYHDGVPPYQETKNYLVKIRRFYREYTGKDL
ncbi:MAG TPA: lytic transglycosylase domain-containing protein [bacterium]|nr:lytic transglycosylase domain-containing protein [bacterium]